MLFLLVHWLVLILVLSEFIQLCVSSSYCVLLLNLDCCLVFPLFLRKKDSAKHVKSAVGDADQVASWTADA